MINSNPFSSSGKTVSKLTKATVAEVLATLEIKPPSIGYQWLDDNFYLPPISSAIPGKWECFPYQRALANFMVSPSIQQLFVKKARRTGLTKLMAGCSCCLTIDRRRKIAIWHPEKSSSEKFVKIEIDPLFRYMPDLSAELDGDFEKSGPHSTLGYKGFKSSYMMFLSAFTGNSMRLIGPDVVMLDEADACAADVGDDGGIIPLLWGRTEQSSARKLIAGSTPLIKGTSIVEAHVEQSDMQLYRFLPCPHCGKYHYLSWSCFKFERSEDKRGVIDAYFNCPECKQRYTYKDYPEMDKWGVWGTKDLEIYYLEDEQVFVDRDSGEWFTEVFRLGIDKLWTAYSYQTSWKELAQLWVDAITASRAGDDSLLKTFIQQNRGQAYEERSGSMSHGQFSNRGERYTPDTLPEIVRFITAGIDVQRGENERVEVELVGWGMERESVHVQYLVIPGNIEDEGTQADLDDALRKVYHTESGKKVFVRCAMIDEGDGGMATEVRRYAKKRRGWVRDNEKGGWCVIRTIKGSHIGPLLDNGRMVGEDIDETRGRMHIMNVVAGKDMLYKQLKIQTPGPGFCHFPIGLPHKYYEGIVSERRTVKRVKGKTVVGYEPKDGSKVRNEPLDCRQYAIGAHVLINSLKRDLRG
jgi:phage terminase large subunit GpA-like protein